MVVGWRKRFIGALSCAVIGGICVGDNICVAQSSSTLSPGLQEVVKLTKAQMTDDVILNYIKTSGNSYSLSADDLINLKSQGVSQPVISALLQAKSSGAPTAPPDNGPGIQTAPTVPPPPTAPPPPPVEGPGVQSADTADGGMTVVNFDYFHDQLSSYGVWEESPGYGWVWRPTEASMNPDWRPYYDQGHWAYSDQGWCWQSDYPWGDVVFHYGRWMRLGGGWAWVPGYDWGPAWVAWRHAEGDGYVGWAPLPPGAEFRAGVGLFWNGRIGVDVDFGLGADAFTFIAFDHFWDHDFRPFAIGRDRARFFYGHSVIRNDYRFDHGRFFVGGIGRDRVALLTHHEVREIHAADFRHEEEHRDIVRREEMHPEIRKANLDRARHDVRPGDARGRGGVEGGHDDHGAHDDRGGHDDHGGHDERGGHGPY